MTGILQSINELVRHGTKIRITVPTIYYNTKKEKQEAIEYLKNNDRLDFEMQPIDDELSIIEIEVIPPEDWENNADGVDI